MRRSLIVSAVALGLSASSSASAYTYVDCGPKNATQIWTGGGPEPSQIFLYLDTGSPAVMMPSDVGGDPSVINRALSLILYAKALGKTVTFRYIAGTDGSAPSCSATTYAVYQRFIGVWMNP